VAEGLARAPYDTVLALTAFVLSFPFLLVCALVLVALAVLCGVHEGACGSVHHLLRLFDLDRDHPPHRHA